MYNINDIRHVHLEISSRCNASCPLCPRNLHGYPFNDGYVERDLSLEDAKKIFKPEFLGQLTSLLINGNLGDMVMNADSLDIIKYFREHNSTMDITISTNGGARPTSFWQDLAKLNCKIWFCVDGLEDTNHLYRQNVVWNIVMNNATAFINAGGHATWQLIDFNFNRPQRDTIQKLAKSMGFKKFKIVNDSRNTTPVFDKTGKLLHTIGTPTETNFQKIIWGKKNNEVLVEDVMPKEIKKINCLAVENQSLYVTSTGEVYPCCWTGCAPTTYGHGNYMEVANKQIANLIKSNNALENSLESCIKWFDSIEKSWTIDNFNNGRLLMCQDRCSNEEYHKIKSTKF